MLSRIPYLVTVVVLAATGTAVAAPPNDSPAGAGVFAPFSAPNGIPLQQEAVADLATATADAGFPRCLGKRSFARTVWYRVPESPASRLVTVEATGQTLAPIDLAAFVQPFVAPPAPVPAPAPATRRGTRQATGLPEPNACDGLGAGGGADAADASSAVSLLLPAGYPVLIQVGRRGTPNAPGAESAVVALQTLDVALEPTPRGDIATAAPGAPGTGRKRLDLAGSTLTGEDPAQPPCPSLGTVWRQLPPAEADGKRLIAVAGSQASTLTVFRGRRPTGDNVVDCVVRDGRGRMQVNATAKAGQVLWVRVGTDGLVGDEEGQLIVKGGDDETVIDGGPGGFDPTPGGAAGGLPIACDSADATAVRITGRDLEGRAADFNDATSVRLRLRIKGSALCDADLRLVGPGGRTYARGRYPGLERGARTVSVPRLRTIVPGRYRLRATGLNVQDRRAKATADVTGRLAKTPRKRAKP